MSPKMEHPLVRLKRALQWKSERMRPRRWRAAISAPRATVPLPSSRGRAKGEAAASARTLSGGNRRWRWVSGFGLLACIALAYLWLAGLVRFADEIPKQAADSATRTDAIVVLTGGSERLATGLQLLAWDRAQRALISGVHPSVAVSDLLRLTGAPASSGNRVDAGYGARDTAGNATEAAEWMQARGYKSLQLVTGNYHMPRSLFEFRCAMPEAQIVPHPVFPPLVDAGAWWSRPGTAALIISEYNKYLFSILRHRVTGTLAHCR